MIKREHPPLPDELEENVEKFRHMRERGMRKPYITKFSTWKPEEPELDYIV